MKNLFALVFLLSSVSFAADPVATPAPQVTPQAAPTEVASEHKVRFAIGLYGSTNGKLTFNSTQYVISGVTTNGNLNYDASGAMGILAEVIYAQPHKAGFSAGISHDSQRKISTPSATTGGALYVPSASNEFKVSFTSLYGNFIYRFETPYVYLGLNVSQAQFSEKPLLLSDSKGSVGAQLGVGFFVGDHLSLDVGISSRGIYADRVTDAGVSVEPRAGSISSCTGTIKYLF